MIYLNERSEGGNTTFYSEKRENGLRKIVACIDAVGRDVLKIKTGGWSGSHHNVISKPILAQLPDI